MVPVIMNHRAYNGSGRSIASCSLISGVVGTRSVTVQISTLVTRTSESPVYL